MTRRDIDPLCSRMESRECMRPGLGAHIGRQTMAQTQTAAPLCPPGLECLRLGIAARGKNRERRTPRHLRQRHGHGRSPRDACHHPRRGHGVACRASAPGRGTGVRARRRRSKPPSTASRTRRRPVRSSSTPSNDLHGMRNAGDAPGQLLRAALDVTRQGRPEARRIAMNAGAASQPRRGSTAACCCSCARPPRCS